MSRFLILQKKVKENKKFFIGIIIVVFVFAFDIWSKRVAFNKVDSFSVKTGGIYNYIPITNFLNLVKVINNGVSFGMFSGLEYAQLILSVITFFIIGYICYLMKQCKDNTTYIYALIIGGGFGNLYDRVVWGGVFDFIDFHIGNWHYPAFNIADSCICVGVGLLLLVEFCKFYKEKYGSDKKNK